MPRALRVLWPDQDPEAHAQKEYKQPELWFKRRKSAHLNVETCIQEMYTTRQPHHRYPGNNNYKQRIVVCLYVCVRTRWQLHARALVGNWWVVEVLAPSSPHHPPAEPSRPANRPHTTTPGLVKREEVVHPPPEACGVPSCLTTRLLFWP